MTRVRQPSIPWIAGLFLLPVVFVILSVSLNLTVNRKLESLNNNVALVSKLTGLESSIRSLEKRLDQRHWLRAQKSSQASWQTLLNEYRNKRAVFTDKDFSIADIKHLIKQTDSVIANLDKLYKAKSFVNSGTPADRASEFEKEVNTAIHIAGTNIKAATAIVEAQLHATSAELLSAHQQNKVLTWFSWIFATFLAVLVVFYSRNLARQRRAESALRESEERYRGLVELSPEAIVVHCEEKIVYVNAAAVKLAKADSPQELLGKPIYGFLHPDCHERIRQRVKRLYEDKKPTELMQVRIVRLDGEIIYAEVAAAPVFHQGKPAAQVVIRNITERKRAEQALRDSEELYRTLVETSPDAVTVTDLEGNITYTSPRTLELYGATDVNELIGKSAFAFISPEDHERARENMLKTLETGTIRDVEYTLLKADGSRYAAEMNVSIVRDHEGNPKAFIATVRDITERKKAQEELRKHQNHLDELIRQRTKELTKTNQRLEREIRERRQAEEALEQKVNQLKSFVNNIPDMAWVKDTESRFVIVNQAFADQVGMSPEELLGKTCEVCFGKEKADKFRQDDLEVMRSGQQAVFDECIYDAKGNPTWLETIKSPIFDSDGKVIGTVGIARDVTKRKRVEEELQRHRDQLDELVKERTAELSQVNARLQREIAKHRETLTALEESERKYRAVFQATGTAMVIIEPDTTLSMVNSQFEKLSGYSKDEVEGKKSWTEFVVKEDLERMKEYHQVRRVVDGGAPRSYEFRFIDRFGNIKDIFLTIDIIPGTQKSVASLLDITERKRSEQALRESEERYRRLVELSPMAIGIHSDGKLVYANPEALKLFGAASLDESLGMSIFDLIHPDDHETVKKRLQQLYEEQPTEPVEIKMIRLNGETIDVEVISTPILHQGKPAGLVVLNDITVRKRAEKQLQDSERKLRRQNEVLVELASRKTLHCGELTSALKEITQTDAATLDVERVSVWLFDKSHTVIRCLDLYELSKNRHSEGIELTAANYPTYFKSLETQRIIAADDAHSDPRTKEFLESYLKPNGISSMLDAPIRSGGKIVGILCHEHVGTVRKWTHEEQNFAASMADLVTLALEASERKQAEAKLQELAAFPENNPDVVLTLNAEVEVLYKNPATLRIFKELDIPEDQVRRFLPDDIEHIVEQCLKTNQKMSDIEKQLAGKTWTWTFHPLQSQGIVHCYAFDITERIKSEQELKKLSAAVIQSANLIVITDPVGVIEYVNPQFTRVTGYSLAEAIGKRPNILKSGRQDKEFYQDLWETITAGKTWSGSLQNRCKNGDIYWERKTITPIFDEKGKIINFLSIGDDITTEIITQQKLAEADKMSAVGMLAAGVAHEFKNYLTGIIGNASFALSELEQEGGLQLAQETLEKIIELGERANDVAMSLLTYSKADPEDFNREDIKKIITKSISLVEQEMRNLSIEIVTYFEDVPEVEVSASKMQQLLLNLLINAQHAIKSDGVITIALLAEGDHIKIKVGDTGIGIPPKNLNKIFDPFFSTKGVWGKDELVGTGMGLSICRNIAREHGGDLTVESVVGVGTTFTLTLPINRQQETSPELLLKGDQSFSVLVFTLDRSIVSHYFQQACEVNARILLIDDITKLPDDVSKVADLVICDAKFSGKIELYRMVEACLKSRVPYVMVNCGTMEYQLADLYENAAANFKQLPEFTRIINAAAVSISRRASTQLS
jgi:PAS domain S-box-containing protein